MSSSHRRFVRLSRTIVNLDAIAYVSTSTSLPADSLVCFTDNDLMLELNDADTATLVAALNAEERDAHAPLLMEYARLRQQAANAAQRFTMWERRAERSSDEGRRFDASELAAHNEADRQSLDASYALETFEQLHPDIVALTREDEDR